MFTNCPPNQSILTWRVPTIYPNDQEHKLAFLAQPTPNNTWVSAFHWSALITDLQRRRSLAAAWTSPGATPFSINFCYSKHLATHRFDIVYMYARDKNCRMTSNKRRVREFTRNYCGRKGSQRKHFQLARRREKSLKVPLDIRRWFGNDSTSSLAVRWQIDQNRSCIYNVMLSINI